jgi:hypothetical protein
MPVSASLAWTVNEIVAFSLTTAGDVAGVMVSVGGFPFLTLIVRVACAANCGVPVSEAENNTVVVESSSAPEGVQQYVNV